MVNKVKISPNDDCPCYSGKKYKKCCRPYHSGRTVPDVVSLVRARFSAYRIGDIDFIIQTTHPQGTSYMADEKRWRARLDAFCLSNRFINLNIIDDGDDWVHFTSYMQSMMQPEPFTAEERSLFKHENGKWLYFDSVEVPEENSAVVEAEEATEE